MPQIDTYLAEKTSYDLADQLSGKCVTDTRLYAINAVEKFDEKMCDAKNPSSLCITIIMNNASHIKSVRKTLKEIGTPCDTKK